MPRGGFGAIIVPTGGNQAITPVKPGLVALYIIWPLILDFAIGVAW